MHVKLIERPAEISRRRKNSRDALEDAQVRIRKRVISLHRRDAWLILLPRTEMADCMNLSRRRGIGQRGLKTCRASQPDSLHDEVVNVENMRIFSRIARNQHQLRV